MPKKKQKQKKEKEIVYYKCLRCGLLAEHDRYAMSIMRCDACGSTPMNGGARIWLKGD